MKLKMNNEDDIATRYLKLFFCSYQQIKGRFVSHKSTFYVTLKILKQHLESDTPVNCPPRVMLL